MEKDFLRKINGKFKSTGVKAVQGHRVAKNLNTGFAILDAISEEINNHIYRKGHRVLGLSSGLIGSGMAFEYQMYKKLMTTIHAIGGFDKESELKLLRNKIKIEYADDAKVYDEKVENSQVFGNQRTRWISAQIHYFRKYFFKGIFALVKEGNVDFFDKAFQQFLLPRIMLLGAVGFFFLLATGLYLSGLPTGPSPLLWAALPILWMLGIFLAVPTGFYNKKTLKALGKVPNAMIVMFLALLKLKEAKKKFIHTPHRVTDISA
jgi:cellulose synthase/poly-beta-1,6-N-acetylglucosamine synthase-like glycosyltransferase